jgi:hypothetical protein
MTIMFTHSRRRWLLFAHLAGMATCLTWLAISPRAEQPAPRTQAPSKVVAEPIEAGRTPWVGVGGCAAAACHGGPIDQPRGEYTTWISRDPHSRAYSMLFGEMSLEMARQLAGSDASRMPPPHQNQLCLKCHAPTGPPTERTPQLVGDGVGCEACHGAAERWSAAHTAVRWKELTPAEQSAKRRELGMTDMHDVLERTQQCTACHVGSEDADVNHDLIAAGHPRMSFEMGAFHAELPKHWPYEAERRRDPALEAKLWAVGHTTSAAAFHELVSTRADQKAGMEFANYDCYACHHELRSPSPRQSDDARISSDGGLRPLEWYDAFGPRSPGSAGESGLPAMKVLEISIPNGGLALQQARTSKNHNVYSEGLRAWAEELNAYSGWTETAVIQAQFALADDSLEHVSWDQATQWYLGIVALERSRRDFQGDVPPSPQAAQIQMELLALKKLLDFPAAADGIQTNSPRDFDPQVFRAAAERLKALITARGDGP